MFKTKSKNLVKKVMEEKVKKGEKVDAEIQFADVTERKWTSSGEFDKKNMAAFDSLSIAKQKKQKNKNKKINKKIKKLKKNKQTKKLQNLKTNDWNEFKGNFCRVRAKKP